jgi:hypothetical protein
MREPIENLALSKVTFAAPQEWPMYLDSLRRVRVPSPLADWFGRGRLPNHAQS